MSAPRILAMLIISKKRRGFYKDKKHEDKRIRSYKQMIAYELAEREKLIAAGRKTLHGKPIKLHNPDDIKRHILRQNREKRDGKKSRKLGFHTSPKGSSHKG